MKIRPLASELFHADRQTDRQLDRQTDMTKLIVMFRNFGKAHKDYTAQYDLPTQLSGWEILQTKVPM